MKRLLSLAVCALVVAGVPALAAGDDASKPQELVDRAIQAMGGSKALAKTRLSIVEDEGTYYGMGDGVPYTGRYVYDMSKPARFRMEILDAFISVVDKEQGWISFMGNTMDLEGEALEVAREGVLVHYATSLIPLEKPGKDYKLAAAEAVTIDDEKCAGIHVDHEGMPTVTIHFSPKTGLIKRTSFKTKAQELEFKEVTDETTIHEYKEFQGVMSPVKLTMTRDGKKFVESNPKTVVFPDELEDKEFKKPE